MMYDPMPQKDIDLPPTKREAELLAEILAAEQNLRECLRIASTKLNTGEIQSEVELTAQPGCICPPTSEQTCQNPLCPRKPVSDWRELHQEEQPRLSEGYTAIRVSRPGVWLVRDTDASDQLCLTNGQTS